MLDGVQDAAYQVVVCVVRSRSREVEDIRCYSRSRRQDTFLNPFRKLPPEHPDVPSARDAEVTESEQDLGRLPAVIYETLENLRIAHRDNLPTVFLLRPPIQNLCAG